MNCITCKTKMNPLVADLYHCPGCSLISSERDPDPTIYDRSYAVKYQRYERTRAGEVLQDIRLEALCFRVASCGSIKILDFGCGSGHFVSFAKGNGWDCTGFDINPYSGFCDVSVLLKRYDAVTFWDSLEHLRDPKAVIMGLQPKYIVASTPNVDAIEGGIKNILTWHHYYPEEHVHYFGKKSLAFLLESCGYEVVLEDYRESEIRTGGGPHNILTMGGILKPYKGDRKMAEDNGKDMALKDNFGAKKGELNQGFTDVPCMTDQQERYKDLEPVPYEWPPKEDGGFLGRAKGEER